MKVIVLFSTAHVDHFIYAQHFHTISILFSKLLSSLAVFSRISSIFIPKIQLRFGFYIQIYSKYQWFWLVEHADCFFDKNVVIMNYFWKLQSWMHTLNTDKPILWLRQHSYLRLPTKHGVSWRFSYLNKYSTCKHVKTPCDTFEAIRM